METVERDETLPIAEEVAAKLDKAVNVAAVAELEETAELRSAAELNTNVVPFKPAPIKRYPDSPRPRINKVNKYVTDINNEFLSTIGGSKDLKVALAKSDNKRAQDLLVALLDPRKSKISTAQLVHRSGLQTIELLDILRDHYIGSGLQEYLKGFQEIAQDTVEDAKSSNRECPKCSGEGVIVDKRKADDEPPKRCTLCSGTGLLRKAGDPDARKLIAQSLKLIQSGSGPNVNVAITNNNHRSFECVIDEVERHESKKRQSSQNGQSGAQSEIIDVTPGA